jgi:DNA polymerase I
MRYLIDVDAWTHEEVWQAALRERGDATEYALVPGTALGLTVNRANTEVLTIPSRRLFWNLDDAPELEWLLELSGIPHSDARGLAKKGDGWKRSKKWNPDEPHGAFDRRSGWVESMQLARQSAWEPEWCVWGDKPPLTASHAPTVSVRAGRDYRVLTDREEIEEARNNLGVGMPNELVAIDFETEGEIPLGLDPVGFSFSYEEGVAWYVPLKHQTGANAPREAAISLLRSIVGGPWLAHNAKFEYHCLLNLGLKPEEISLPHDTIVLAHQAGKTKALKPLAWEELGERMTTFEEVAGRYKKQFSRVPIPEAVSYGCADSDMALRLYHRACDPAFAWFRSPVYESISRPLMPILAAMERRGLGVDLGGFARWADELEVRARIIRLRLLHAAGLPLWHELNLNSPRQVQWLLFTHLGLPGQRRTDSGQVSTDDDTLLALREWHPAVELLRDWRENDKLRSTYAIGLPEAAQRFGDGRIHPLYNATRVKTGRLASEAPNGQNVPARARDHIASDDGFIFAGSDYSAVELRILAAESGERVYLDSFRAGGSPHGDTLRALFGHTDKDAYPEHYKLSKNINFSIPYGTGAQNVVDYARAGGLKMDVQEARQLLTDHRRTYPAVWGYLDDLDRHLLKYGWIDTLQGHRSWYPDVNSEDETLRSAALREGRNARIQGTAGLATCQAMVDLPCAADLLVLNVHDELVELVPYDEAGPRLDQLQSVMVEALQPYVPACPITTEGHLAPTWRGLK